MKKFGTLVLAMLMVAAAFAAGSPKSCQRPERRFGEFSA